MTGRYVANAPAGLIAESMALLAADEISTPHDVAKDLMDKGEALWVYNPEVARVTGLLHKSGSMIAVCYLDKGDYELPKAFDEHVW